MPSGQLAASLLMIDLSGPSLTADERSLLSELRPGGVCLFGRNVTDRVQLADFVAELRSLTGNELLVAVDQEGGGVVRVADLPYPPSAMALGAADDTQLTREVAAATARGLRATGINIDFAPVADVNSNPANPVIADRSFGADPQQVARHVAAFVSGLQSEGVAATAKHFPGHGDVDVDSHLALPRLDRSAEELEMLELLPFRAAIAAGTAAVMSGHLLIDRIDPEFPATLSRAAITGLLRHRLGFEGVVFTDSLDMKGISSRWPAEEAAVLALAAGVDMTAHVGPLREHAAMAKAIERALDDGRLDLGALERSRQRLLSLGHSFPARPHTAAWLDGDEQLLGEAARRGLITLGRLPSIGAGSKLLLVSAGEVRQGAATQERVRPAATLAQALRFQGVQVQERSYDPARAMAAAHDLAQEAGQQDVLVFASSSRTALSQSERELGRFLADRAPGFVHVALWNPYATSELPGPALVTFGWRERSAKAAAAVLTGGSVSGSAPIPLRTFDDLER